MPCASRHDLLWAARLIWKGSISPFGIRLVIAAFARSRWHFSRAWAHLLHKKVSPMSWEFVSPMLWEYFVTYVPDSFTLQCQDIGNTSSSGYISQIAWFGRHPYPEDRFHLQIIRQCLSFGPIIFMTVSQVSVMDCSTTVGKNEIMSRCIFAQMHYVDNGGPISNWI